MSSARQAERSRSTGRRCRRSRCHSAARSKTGALQSTPWWPPRVVPPADAPNVLLIITDDVGLRRAEHLRRRDSDRDDGRPCGRGVCATPTSTPPRSARRRARRCITGRNHHSAGFGVISEQSTGFPGYNSIIEPDKATIGRMLLDNGYNTSWFGKDHNMPAFQASQAGPFDQWPTGMGFQYFYGFVGGDANQWQPNLFRNTTQIYPFDGATGEWNLITAMADDAIGWISRHAPDRSVEAVPREIRPRRHPRPASPDQGMGREDRGDEPLRRRLRGAARTHLREPEADGPCARGRDPDALAGGHAQALGSTDRHREEAVHQAGRGLCRLRSPIRTTRSVG